MVPRQHAQDARLRAARDAAGKRGLGEETAVARAALGREHHDLSFESLHGPVDVGGPGEDAGVVHRVASHEVVRTVDDDVVSLHQVHRVVRVQRHVDGGQLEIGVERLQAFGRRLDLGSPLVSGIVEDLALQVRDIDLVELDQREVPDPGCRQVESGR